MSRSGLAQCGRSRRTWGRAVVLALFGLLSAAVALALAATYRPAWYDPASVDRARLPTDKRDLVTLLDEIGAALNEGRSYAVRLDADQVNRWIAARAEIWPDAETDLGPLTHPWISFLDDRVRAAATIERGSLRAVLSLTCRVRVADGRFELECAGARLGALPVPRAWVSGWISALPALGAERFGPATAAGITFENDWVWPNGKRRFRFADLQLRAKTAAAVIEPWPQRR